MFCSCGLVWIENNIQLSKVFVPVDFAYARDSGGAPGNLQETWFAEAWRYNAVWPGLVPAF